MDKFAMIIFGASGDLTKRKLMPALYSLYRDKRLTGDFSILGIGRTIYSDENYRSYILEELQQFVKADEQDTILMSSFVSHLYYLPLDPAKEEGYPLLRQRLVELTNEVDPDNLLFYLATPPSLYGVVPLHLKAAGLNTPHSRIIVEKPFGYDLEYLCFCLQRAPDLPYRPFSWQGNCTKRACVPFCQRYLRTSLES